MLTASGRQFWPLDPRPEDLDIHDIAAGLANQARYNGQTSRHYSVAQHSVHLADWFAGRYDLGLAQWALLHDAAEAYLGDMIRPLKASMPDYLAAEARLEAVIFARYGLTGPMPAAVKDADTSILTDEMAHLFPTESVERYGLHKRPRLGISPARLTPAEACAWFLRRFDQYF